MDKFLSLGAILIIAFGVLALADGVVSTKPMLGAWEGAAITFSGITTYVFAEILAVLKDIRRAVTSSAQRLHGRDSGGDGN